MITLSIHMRLIIHVLDLGVCLQYVCTPPDVSVLANRKNLPYVLCKIEKCHYLDRICQDLRNAMQLKGYGILCFTDTLQHCSMQL